MNRDSSVGSLAAFLAILDRFNGQGGERADRMLRPSPDEPMGLPMTPNDKQFFKKLGSRVAQLRQQAGLSQQAVADQIGVAQQTLAHYEVGRLRVPVSLLPKLAQLFGVTGDELLGVK